MADSGSALATEEQLVKLKLHALKQLATAAGHGNIAMPSLVPSSSLPSLAR